MLLAAPTRSLLLHTVAHTLLCCMLLHARHIRCPLLHTCWLPAIHCDHAPLRRRLQLHQRTLLAAAPMPPLLHNTVRMPLAPLLQSPLPPPPLLVPGLLIAK
jgi:hypothetical protein